MAHSAEDHEPVKPVVVIRDRTGAVKLAIDADGTAHVSKVDLRDS